MKYRNLLLSLSLCVLGATAQADWLLDEQHSTLNFLTTKNSNITEISSFGRLSGVLSEKGTANLLIDLNSINTRIPLRDERIRNLLLNTDKYPNATVQVTLAADTLQNLLVGKSLTTEISGTLDLHGKQLPLIAKVHVFKDENGAIHATTTEPVLLDMVTLGLTDGIETLRELAKLNNISYMVPVTFKLVYTPLPL